MTWNFWIETHHAVLALVKVMITPRLSKNYILSVGLSFLILISVALLSLYHVQGSNYLRIIVASAITLATPVAYLYSMVGYLPSIFHCKNLEVQNLTQRLFARHIEESCIVSLGEYMSEIKQLGTETVITEEQFLRWTERYQGIIQAVYIIISKGISNNCALAFVAYPTTKPRYIKGSYNDEHAVWRFNLQKYAEKLAGIVDGYYLTLQHSRSPKVVEMPQRELLMAA